METGDCMPVPEALLHMLVAPPQEAEPHAVEEVSM
jgi:hypothetical protein